MVSLKSMLAGICAQGILLGALSCSALGGSADITKYDAAAAYWQDRQNKLAENKKGVTVDAAISRIQNSHPPVVASTGASILQSAEPPFPFPMYLISVSRIINRHWHPPEYSTSKTVCGIAFDIDRDGNTSKGVIEQSSGNEIFDRLALRAVIMSSLPALPKELTDDHLRMHIKLTGNSADTK